MCSYSKVNAHVYERRKDTVESFGYPDVKSSLPSPTGEINERNYEGAILGSGRLVSSNMMSYNRDTGSAISGGARVKRVSPSIYRITVKGEKLLEILN